MGSTTSAPESWPPFDAPAAHELLDVLTRSDTDRTALIGRLSLREDTEWLAEFLIDVESDPDDVPRLQLIDVLRAVIG
jgi:hypothetical protein